MLTRVSSALPKFPCNFANSYVRRPLGSRAWDSVILVVDDEPAVRDRARPRPAAGGVRGRRSPPDGGVALETLARPRPRRGRARRRHARRSTGSRSAGGCARPATAPPVLMLTARDAVDDRVAGLDAGADDYLVKPFALRELQARLRALLRRTRAGGRRRCCRWATWSWTSARTPSRAGARTIELTRTEFALLQLLLEHPGQVLTRSTIFERVWGYDFGATSNTLGVYVGLPAAQARGRRRAAAAAHGARARLRPARSD